MNDIIEDKKELFTKIIRALLVVQELTKNSVVELTKEDEKTCEIMAGEISIMMQLYANVFGIDKNIDNIRGFLNKSTESDEDFPLPEYVE